MPKYNKKSFKRNIGVVHRVIRNRLGKTKRVVHGARAQNAQLPKYLEKKDTVDWDIFAKNPRKAAREMERALDKKFRADVFAVKKGKTKALDVRKVYSKVTGEAYVDYARPDRIVPTVSKQGIRYAHLKDQLMRAKLNLKDPERAFRADKDRDLIRRVRKFEKSRGKKI